MTRLSKPKKTNTTQAKRNSKRRGKTLEDDNNLTEIADVLIGSRWNTIKGFLDDIVNELDRLTNHQFMRDKVLEIAAQRALSCATADYLNLNYFPDRAYDMPLDLQAYLKRVNKGVPKPAPRKTKWEPDAVILEFGSKSGGAKRD